MDDEERRLIQDLLIEVRELRADRRGPVKAATTLLVLHKSWSDAKRKLPSFACDNARALLVLSFAPPDGPHAGVPLSQRDPTTLTAVDVDLYRAWRYRCETRRKGPPAPATVNREVMVLKRILNFAVKRQTIDRNPVEGLEDDDEDNVREVIIDEAGFALIIAEIESPVVTAYATLAYDSAMRRTECLLSRWSWLDERNGFIRIPSAVAKNGEGRTADLSRRALAAVRSLPHNLHSECIFVNPENRELYDPRWLYELYHRAVVASGVRGPSGEVPTFHDLRRSWCTLAGRRGIPESVWRKKSGHKDHAVVERYRIVAEEDLRVSRQRMEEARAEELAALARR